MNFVLDNSVTMRWFFGDGQSQELAYARRVLEALNEDNALVPVTWGLEVANVIARAESRQLVSEARSRTFLEMLDDLEIITDAATHSHALTNTLDLARRYRLSAYGATHLELALQESVPLATLDDELRKAAKRAGVRRFC